MLIPQSDIKITFNKITGSWKATLTLTDVFCYCKPLCLEHTTCEFVAFAAIGTTGEVALKSAIESVYRVCSDKLRERFDSKLCIESLQDLQIQQSVCNE